MTLWIFQWLLAAVFLMSGTSKLMTPRLTLAEKFPWAKDYSDCGVKLIGLAELLGAIGLILPSLLGVARVLTPFAALGLTALMIGAVGTHLKAKDGHFAPATLLAVLSAIVACGRF